MNVAARLAATAARAGGATALKLDGTELTYRALDTASARLAALLRERAVAAGEPVALLLPNVPELGIVYYGALRAGCVAASLPADGGEGSLRARLHAVGARLLFAWHALAEVAEAAARDTATECVFVSPREFGQLLATVDPAHEVAEREDSAPALLTPSGTVTHAQLCARADAAARSLELGEKDVVLAVSPLAEERTGILTAAVTAGGCVTLLPRFDARHAFELVARDRVSVLEGSAEAFTALLEPHEHDTASLRVCVGETLPVELRQRAERSFGCRVVDPRSREPAAARSGGDGLRLDGVSVRFGGLTALDDVSVHVARGRVVGVIGPNGAGKTTLFNVVCGFLRPDSGKLAWGDRSLTGVRPHQLARLGIARTLQGVGLFRNLTALENVMVAAEHLERPRFATALLGLPRSDRAERRLRTLATEALGAAGVADAAEREAGSLPYPIQKRVSLARALVGRPRLLLLDEPAGGLGGDDVAGLADLIRGFGGSITVLLVEHRMDLVMSVCDEVVVLDSGRLIARGTPSEVQRDARVLEAYLGAEAHA